MFGFGKAKEKQPRKQGYILTNGRMGTLPDNQPIRYAANGNSLVVAGTVWPPILRDDGYRDNSELFEAIAEGLNNLPATRFTFKKLRELAADYEKGKINATDVTKTIVNIVRVTKDIKVG
jgi:hypothetical protein